jgi:hypothetical protein
MCVLNAVCETEKKSVTVIALSILRRECYIDCCDDDDSFIHPFIHSNELSKFF